MAEPDEFQQFEADLASRGGQAAWERLAARFAQQKRYHELFDARLAQHRHRLGLPLYASGELQSLSEPLRSQLEEGYLEACREVGQLLLDEGQFRQAWLYLRPAGETDRMRQALTDAAANDDNCQELIEVALYEGVAPQRGYALVLSHLGTCNAISTFESVAQGQDRTTQQGLAALLLRHLYAELLSNLRGDVVGSGGPGESSAVADEASSATLAELLAGIEGTFGEYCCHVDASHLSAVVRYGRLLTDPEELRLAWELTEYGRRLHSNFRTPGEEPFTDLYESHGLFFAAQLGQRVDEAVEYFRARAAAADIYEQGTAAVEVFTILLARLGRHEEAMQALAAVPAGTPTSRLAPSLIELSQQAGQFRTLQAICRERGDLLGFAIGRLEEARRAAGSSPA